MRDIINKLSGERGQTMTEYALVVLALVIVTFLAWEALRWGIHNADCNVNGGGGIKADGC